MPSHSNGTFPLCGGCGARVAHYTVKVCFHCKHGSPDKWKPAPATETGHHQTTDAPTSIGHDRPPGWDAMGFLARVAHRKREQQPAAHSTPRPPTIPANPGALRRYVERAMDAELDRLAAAPKGCQNTILHAVACNIFELVKAGFGSRHAAVQELTRIADAIGHDGDTNATLNSAWNKVGPRQLPTLVWDVS